MHFIIEFSNGIVQLSSVYNICAIKSMIVLEMKCPQLSKPEATAARNENSIGDRMEKKPWEKPGSVGGASSPLARRISSLFQLQQSQSVSGPLVPGLFPRWMSRWRGPHWRSVSGAHLQCPPLILAPLINMSKGGCENKSALFILLIFHSINSQNSNLSLKSNNWKWGENLMMK